MNHDEFDDGNDLLQRLARMVTVAAPVPSDVLQSARASFDLRSRSGDLAELVYDSVLDDDRLVGVRGDDDGARQLTFVGAGLTVEVEMLAEDRRLVGQVVPAGPGRLEVRHPRGSSGVDVDDLGRFVADTVPSGPISLRWEPSSPGDGPPTVTDWVTL